jgi:hypothetical protein
LAAGAPRALAEDYTFAPGQIEYEEPKLKSKPGEITTQATPMGGIFRCAVPWASVQSAPSGFVIGNCKQNSELHRQMKSDQYDGTYWDGGWVTGNFAGCGWIRVDYSNLVPNSTAYTLCNPNSIGYALSEFALWTNDGTTPKYPNCSDNSATTKCTDGTATTASVSCYAYRNFRPWLSGQQVTDPVAIYPAGKVFKWRYITRYTATNFGNSYFALVRDPALSPGQGNWMFVPTGCLSSFPGAVQV